MEATMVTLVLLAEGRKRKVPFPRNAGFEELKSLLAREFAPKTIVEFSYMSDGDVFASAATPNAAPSPTSTQSPPPNEPPLSAHADTPNEPSLHSQSPPPDVDGAAVIPLDEPPPADRRSERATQPAHNAPADEVDEGAVPPEPLPPPLATQPAPNEPLNAPADDVGDGAVHLESLPTQQPLNAPADDVDGAVALELIPPLAMCTLRLEAVGLPPRMVEIAPDEAEAMRLEEFMGLLAVDPMWIPTKPTQLIHTPTRLPSHIPGAGLVDSPESLHAVLRASLTQPVVLQVPLQPTKAERLKLKRQQKRKGKQQQEGQQPQEADGLEEAAAVADASVEASPTAPTPAGQTASSPLDDQIALLAARLGASPTDLLAHPDTTQAVLTDIACLASGDPTKMLPLLGRALVDPLVRLLAARSDLPTSSPALAETLFSTIATLSVTPENRAAYGRAAFGRAGATYWLVKMLAASPDLPRTHPEQAVKLYRAIATLAVDPQNQTMFLRDGIVAPFVRMLVDHPDLPVRCPAVAEWYFMALTRLTSDPEGQNAFWGAEIVPPLFRVLRDSFDLVATSPNVAQWLFHAIANLAMANEHRAAFVPAGVVTPLIRLLDAHPDMPQTHLDPARRIFLALANLADHSENLVPFARAGAVPALAKLLAANPNLLVAHSGIAQLAFDTISVLAIDPANRSAFGRAGVVLLLSRMLVQSDLTTPHPIVLEQFLAAIANLAADPENKQAFGRAGVSAPLVGLLGYSLPPAISRHLLRAISNLLIESADNYCFFVRDGIIPALLRLLPTLTTPDPVVAEQFTRVVIMLLWDPENRVPLTSVRPYLQRFRELFGVASELVEVALAMFD
ncbi:hypothetical protein PAPYR_9164 [Paratrimastix pyriformis]|uniref:Uncharacterized protein n=1 Tax=Paratrimastix pyriformis TaxID=342808 RepID=A0ABQ8U903_9EUKA|nr:hypothetical protein PAPYR_9164 [Paratrimastix pyriformis]